MRDNFPTLTVNERIGAAVPNLIVRPSTVLSTSSRSQLLAEAASGWAAGVLAPQAPEATWKRVCDAWNYNNLGILSNTAITQTNLIVFRNLGLFLARASSVTGLRNNINTVTEVEGNLICFLLFWFIWATYIQVDFLKKEMEEHSILELLSGVVTTNTLLVHFVVVLFFLYLRFFNLTYQAYWPRASIKLKITTKSICSNSEKIASAFEL